MEIITDIRLTKKISDAVISVGKFDGVHLGHKKVLQHLTEKAKATGGTPVVLTFDPPPLKLIAPEKNPPLLTTFEQKAELLERMGIEILLCMHLDKKMANYSIHELLELVQKNFTLNRLVEGPHLCFGIERLDSSEKLMELGEKMGFSVDIVDYCTVDGEIVSTARIREYIQQGLVKKASRLLGRLYCLEGKVVSGEKRGKDLGFPTANLASENELLPKDGVYAVLVDWSKSKKRCQGVTNIGKNPTFKGSLRTVETFILDFREEIYGDRLRISFVERLRDEITFSSAAQLIHQIEKDVASAKKILNALQNP